MQFFCPNVRWLCVLIVVITVFVNPLVSYEKGAPLIWIGGVPRSGTTLMRVMLDAHPDVRCGEETHLIPRILKEHQKITDSEKQMNRLLAAHITEDVLNDALGAYLLSIIASHGEPAPRLCNKDPFALRHTNRIHKVFPRSKFVLMLRDGRATAHSLISRHVSVAGFDTTTYRGALRDWNRAISIMYSECLAIGASVCLPVYYEQLVLHPEAQMNKILTFLEIPWNDLVLHHEETIGKKNGVSLSALEYSTDQVVEAVNTGALTKWVRHIPMDVRAEMTTLAPMLATLGYDPNSYPPNYGNPDQQVAENSLKKDEKGKTQTSEVYSCTKETHA
ncbi:hypothetical protein CAPTEDRAFT_188754 [Capitella teleta]|uniref:Protein-tyrosine sulfotransferase n=1 Tax=Capitella teleta TaxID=283909 RepID=R7UET1_CAPTE|nr:hypothetical protein CAPTEDRAFT_188754 [Capitella teleta]|eukprot:ELU02303.1 hypothetical protein CAPTEDRAFT_188754 [Capitella teleta]